MYIHIYNYATAAALSEQTCHQEVILYCTIHDQHCDYYYLDSDLRSKQPRALSRQRLRSRAHTYTGYSLQRGAVGGGVQCVGVVLYDKLYNIIQITTSCFHCAPL